MASSQEKIGPSELQLAFELYEPDGLEPVYANVIRLASSQDEAVITFFQALPPAVFSQEKRGATIPIRAKAIAKIVVPHAVAERFTKDLEEWRQAKKS